MSDPLRAYAQAKLQQRDYDCAKEYTLSLFSGKYKIVIIYHLFHDGTLRFSQLQRLLDGATHKVLTQQLQELRADGVITRREERINNRKAVYYSLTLIGASLMPIVEAMFSWGSARLAALQLAEPKG
ncbi:winged helix-turn-helix transcriptional regulator [Lacticaseibacillus thailandensis]|uniref:winged helix-turn-helix transcriptional regulator n=1 Tax=Lacticaseibacillus thailandensis TaxID=381741 RepID=UPI0006D17191|nr:helix-turn-helix domain-containing protein [Lacticaseibacillus thailandensis]